MTKIIRNLTADEYEEMGVELKAGADMEMEDEVAEYFLEVLKGQVEEVKKVKKEKTKKKTFLGLKI